MSASVVIVAGHVTVEPEQRESYLAACGTSSNRDARQPVAWTSRSTVPTFSTPPGSTSTSGGLASRPQAVRSIARGTGQDEAMPTVSVADYVIADMRPLFGEDTP